MAGKTISVTLNTNTIDIVRDPSYNNVIDPYQYASIIGVTPVFNQRPTTATAGEWIYPYNTMTILLLQIKDKKFTPIKIELQDISNQPTWSTGLLTGIQQAITDIQAKL
jgi:hypothetical protein